MSVSGSWCNNIISKALNEQCPKDFSTCDIDGVVREEYESGSLHHTRLVIYESKNGNEILGIQQCRTLTTLSASINWSQFDDRSGIFVIRVDNPELTDMRLYQLNEGRELYLCSVPNIERLHYWFAAVDKRQDVARLWNHFINKT